MLSIVGKRAAREYLEIHPPSTVTNFRAKKLFRLQAVPFKTWLHEVGRQSKSPLIWESRQAGRQTGFVWTNNYSHLSVCFQFFDTSDQAGLRGLEQKEKKHALHIPRSGFGGEMSGKRCCRRCQIAKINYRTTEPLEQRWWMGWEQKFLFYFLLLHVNHQHEPWFGGMDYKYIGSGIWLGY